MKKSILKGRIVANDSLNESYYLLRIALFDDPRESISFNPLPGQFVQVKATVSNAFLRRPISICDYDNQSGILDLLVQRVGVATRQWATFKVGDSMSILAPLGNGFQCDLDIVGMNPLLVGGGVGVAPLLMLAKKLHTKGIKPSILLGTRRAELIVLEERFAQFGTLYFATEDGSKGEKGLVTQHSIWNTNHSYIYTCGPLPMMKAVASLAKKHHIPCEVSLENKMACGIGSCLCCVEDTVDGHKCTCTDGPVFNIEQLLWL